MSGIRKELDPEIVSWLDRIGDVVRQNGAETSGEAERDAAQRLSDLLFAEFGDSRVKGVERWTHDIPGPGGGLRIDEYRSKHALGRAPAYLLLHGGAFRLGSIDEKINVAFCGQRAAAADYSVFSLDYRLAPEHPYPAALQDASAALNWLVEFAPSLRIDPVRIVVGGVSAGANLAAALCLQARDNGGPRIRGQLLEVPVVDLRDDAAWGSDYARINGFSTAADLRGDYATMSQAELPTVSPGLADLRGMPATHIMTAEFDPLREAGEQFADRLRAAGNSVSATRHLGQLHGTQGLTQRLRAARLWHAEVVAVLKEFA